MYILTATPVRIGVQQTMYSVYETDGYQVVCAEIQSGDIAGRMIEISYSTTSGTALGRWTFHTECIASSYDSSNI